MGLFKLSRGSLLVIRQFYINEKHALQTNKQTSILERSLLYNTTRVNIYYATAASSKNFRCLNLQKCPLLGNTAMIHGTKYISNKVQRFLIILENILSFYYSIPLQNVLLLSFFTDFHTYCQYFIPQQPKLPLYEVCMSSNDDLNALE